MRCDTWCLKTPDACLRQVLVRIAPIPSQHFVSCKVPVPSSRTVNRAHPPPFPFRFYGFRTAIPPIASHPFRSLPPITRSNPGCATAVVCIGGGAALAAFRGDLGVGLELLEMLPCLLDLHYPFDLGMPWPISGLVSLSARPEWKSSVTIGWDVSDAIASAFPRVLCWRC